MWHVAGSSEIKGLASLPTEKKKKKEVGLTVGRGGSEGWMRGGKWEGGTEVRRLREPSERHSPGDKHTLVLLLLKGLKMFSILSQFLLDIVTFLSGRIA